MMPPSENDKGFANKFLIVESKNWREKSSSPHWKLRILPRWLCCGCHCSRAKTTKKKMPLIIRKALLKGVIFFTKVPSSDFSRTIAWIFFSKTHIVFKSAEERFKRCQKKSVSRTVSLSSFFFFCIFLVRVERMALLLWEPRIYSILNWKKSVWNLNFVCGMVFKKIESPEPAFCSGFCR